MNTELAETTNRRLFCEGCQESATRQDAEGVPLCEGCYDHLLEHWAIEGFGHAEHT